MNLSHKYDYIESYESPLLITKFEGGLEWPDMLVISKWGSRKFVAHSYFTVLENKCLIWEGRQIFWYMDSYIREILQHLGQTLAIENVKNKNSMNVLVPNTSKNKKKEMICMQRNR